MPFGKDRNALSMSTAHKKGADGKVEVFKDCGRGIPGCSSFSNSHTCGDGRQISVSLSAAQAFPNSPSRHKDSARRKRIASFWVAVLAPPFLAGGLSAQRVARSPACQRLMRSRVKEAISALLSLFDTGGGHRTHPGSIANSVHASAVLKWTAAASARTKTAAHCVLALAGTYFTVGGLVQASCKGIPGEGGLKPCAEFPRLSSRFRLSAAHVG